MKNWLSTIARRHPLVSFFVLADAISWVLALPLIASAQGFFDLQVPFALHYLTAYGPLLAALAMSAICDGREGMRELLGRMLRWRIGLGWLLIAMFSPLALFAISAVAVYVAGGLWPDVGLLGQVSYLPSLGIGTWALWIFTSGVGEETGWRGFALPRLQKNHGALVATLILAAFWVIWHVPFFFYLESYVKMGLGMLPVFALGVTAGAIVFTWLYNSTNGSILAVILWHGGFNFVTATRAGQGTAAAIASMLVMVWALMVVILLKPANLSHAPKQVM